METPPVKTKKGHKKAVCVLLRAFHSKRLLAASHTAWGPMGKLYVLGPAPTLSVKPPDVTVVPFTKQKAAFLMGHYLPREVHKPRIGPRSLDLPGLDFSPGARLNPKDEGSSVGLQQGPWEEGTVSGD